jgi:hypothetical protein
MSVVSVMCCQVEFSAANWSLVQRSPTDCVASLCVIKKPREWWRHDPRWASTSCKKIREIWDYWKFSTDTNYNNNRPGSFETQRWRMKTSTDCALSTVNNSYVYNGSSVFNLIFIFMVIWFIGRMLFLIFVIRKIGHYVGNYLSPRPNIPGDFTCKYMKILL